MDTPQALYRSPATLFVAAFIGSPAMNLVEVDLGGRDDAVEFGGHRIPLGGARPARGGRLVLGIRPEAFEDAAFGDPSLPQIDVDVAVMEELGSDAHAIFPVDAPRVEVEELRETGEAEALLADDGAVFTARLDARTDARPGRPLRLSVDPSAFHFFDAATGEAVPRAATLEAVAETA